MRHFLLLIAALYTLGAYSQPAQPRPAPYIQCHVGGQAPISYLPLQNFTVNAKISGIIVDVSLEQTFVNSFNTPLEVTYIFPGSSKSAVYGLTMTIGDRVVNAEVQEKYQAHANYANAVNDGYRASLLEQTRPNVFQMRIGNIMPQDTIVVSLQYTEFLESQNGNYQFVVPTTIGERYAGENRKGEDAPLSANYTNDALSPYPLNINIDLSSPVPIGNVRSSTHKIDFDVMDSNNWHIFLNPTERYAANQDFIFEYRLRGEQLESGLLLHEGDAEKFFMLQIQPPKQITYDEIPPREYIFILDVSGSMQGFPMATAKDLLEELLNDLKPNDIFNIIPFEFVSSKLFTTSQLATSENINAARRFMRTRASSGGTNMTSAFHDVYRSIGDEPISRSIILITDGQVEAEKRVFQEIRNNLYKANVFAFGIGVSVNRYLIEGVANAGMGEAYMVTNSAFAAEQARSLAKYIKRPALTNIVVNFGDNLVYDVSPPSLPDVLSERPLTIYGKYEGEMIHEISIKGTSGKGTYQKMIQLPFASNNQNPALTYLWARNRLKDIEDFGSDGNDRTNAIMQIGLQYSLLTDYTSFIAVDSELANISNQLVAMAQPLARPVNPIPNNIRQTLSATGAVSRAVGASKIKLNLPDQGTLSAPIILVSWVENHQGPYTLSVVDIFDRKLMVKEVLENYFWLNLNDLNNASGIYLLRITDQAGEQSNEIALKQTAGLGQTYGYLYDLNSNYSHEIYLKAINDLISDNLLIDTFTLLEIAIMYYPESEWMNQKRMEIWSALGLN